MESRKKQNCDSIRFDELMREIDKYRSHREIKINEQQREFIKACRESDNKVTWPVMTELWERLGWGRISVTAMRVRSHRIMREDNNDK